MGLHLTPTAGAPSDSERWTVRRGSLRLRTRIVTVSRNLRRRAEQVRVTFDIQTPTGSLPLENRIVLRTYTAGQFLPLVHCGGVRDRRDSRLLLPDRCAGSATAPHRRRSIRPPQAARRERQTVEGGSFVPVSLAMTDVRQIVSF